MGYDKLLFKMIVYCSNSHVPAVEGDAKVAVQEGKVVHTFHHDPLQHSLLCLVRGLIFK